MSDVVKSRDTCDQSPFTLRTLTDEDFSFLRDFRDAALANGSSLTGNPAEIRTISTDACDELNKVHTGSHTTETSVEVSTDHDHGKSSAALAGSRFEFRPVQLDQLERGVTARHLRAAVLDVADGRRSEPDQRPDFRERHSD